MKKLIFIDNDNNIKAIEAIDYVKDNLEYHGGLSAEQVSKIEIIPDFHFVYKDAQYKMMFDLDNAIITWSMFTATHYNSLGKLSHFLKGAGRYNIKGKTYIDTANGLKKALIRIIEGDTRDVHYFIRGIERNNIIGFDSNISKFFRYRFNGVDDDFIINEEVNLLSLLTQ